jgi:5-methylcytosine-specific restriction enzyme subunit McrC
MLRISEHFEYYQNNNHFETFEKVPEWQDYYDLSVLQDTILFYKEKDKPCVTIALENESESIERKCYIQSSYYIGLDCFPNLGLNVNVMPKLNSKHQKVDYVRMLLEALTEPKNFDHLKGLIETKFENDWIEIENHDQLLLTPFLLAQFLAIVKDLVKKGLKKSYYTKNEDLKNQIKGKILVTQQIKKNILKNRLTYTTCQYQEFGFDIKENQFLKYVLSKIQIHLDTYSKKSELYINLLQLSNFCSGGFQQVSSHTFTKLEYLENNPFYKNYNLAISLGNQILKLFDYNVSKTLNQKKVKHPPFWIDMSKLFELFVFKKLREKFSNEGEVKYHLKYNRQEPDFILNTNTGIKAVVDAKYKPRYKSGNPSKEDARQLAGYTRLNTIYRELDIEEDKIIPAYFIYPSELVNDIKEINESKESDNWNDVIELNILDSSLRSSSTYKNMYLQEILLYKS